MISANCVRTQPVFSPAKVNAVRNTIVTEAGHRGCHCVACLRHPHTAIEPDERRNLTRIRRAYRSLTLRHGLPRLIRAGGVGLIVGIGMAIFLPFVDQPPMLLGIGSGIAAFLMMLFVG